MAASSSSLGRVKSCCRQCPPPSGAVIARRSKKCSPIGSRRKTRQKPDPLSDDLRDRSVFLNCPFDKAFQPLFDAIVFSLLFCGFRVRSALEIRDSGELRLAKIVRLVEQCRFSIHDLSRVELDQESGLPRFNMPIELGIAIGMKYLGRASLRDHLLLVLDSERYRYQRFASDLAGVDIAAHHNRALRALSETRDFLAPNAGRNLPGATTIANAYEAFLADLPDLAASARQDSEELTYTDRLKHIETFLETLA